MRSVSGFLVLVAAACAEPKPVPVVVPPLAIAPLDAGAPVAVARATTPGAASCVLAPCTAARGMIAMTVVGTDVWGIPIYGPIDPVPLVRRGQDEAAETVVVADVRPRSTASFHRILGDAAGLVFRTTEGIATWQPAQGAAQTISTESPIAEIALDGESIFFVTGDCLVKRQPRSGGPSTLLGKPPSRYCFSPIIAYDAADLFFNALQTLYALPRAGGAARQLAKLPPDTHVLGIHVDAASVWVLATTVVRGPEAVLHRIPKQGGKMEQVRLLERSGPRFGLAGDETQLFWIESTSKSHVVMRMAKDGGDAIVVARGTAQAHTLVATPEFLYWGREGNPAKDPPHDVLRIARSGY